MEVCRKSVGPEVMQRWHPAPECTRFEHLSSLLLKPTHLHGYRAHEQAQPPPVDASPQVSVGDDDDDDDVYGRETLVCIKREMVGFIEKDLWDDDDVYYYIRWRLKLEGDGGFY